MTPLINKYSPNIITSRRQDGIPNTEPYALVDLAVQYWERRDLFKQNKKLFTPDEILIDVCQALETDVGIIKSKSRKREVALVRHIYCFVANKVCGLTLREVGLVMGRGDHTTILHSCRTVQDLMDTQNPQFLDQWNTYLQKSKLFTVKQLNEPISHPPAP